MSEEESPHAYLRVAFDFPSLAEAEYALDELQKVGLQSAKIGYHLIYATDGGPQQAAAMLTRRGLLDDALLDSKLKDGPKTMEGAVIGIRALGYRHFTVHATAGPRGVVACAEYAQDAEIVLVTLLTHLDEEDLPFLGYPETVRVEGVVRSLIGLSYILGIRSVVCSARELAAFRKQGLFSDVHFSVPGVRLPGSEAGDQRRIGDPYDIIRLGAREVIVGQDITGRPRGSRADAYLRYCDRIAAAL